MQYLCVRQLTAGEKTYYPGDIIPDNVILAKRSSKLISNGYISEIGGEIPQGYSENQSEMFTQEQVDRMVAEAVAGLKQEAAERKEFGPVAYDGVIQISVNGENEQITAVPATPEEIQQAFFIMQLNAAEGAEAITDVKSENVLILLHAADSRKTIKEAAKKQADNLFSTKGDLNEASNGNETTSTNAEGADT